MDAAYVPAFFGLAGATVGALASFTTTWITQVIQIRERRTENGVSKREQLFESFITEAARLYGDALGHEKDDIDDLVLIYAVLARMNLVASRAVVDAGGRVIDSIIETYMTPNLTLRQLRELAQDGKLNVLQEFAAECRKELGSF